MVLKIWWSRSSIRNLLCTFSDRAEVSRESKFHFIIYYIDREKCTLHFDNKRATTLIIDWIAI